MDIPNGLKTRMLSELEFIINKIETESDIKRKIYFLSAAHGSIERTMRFHSKGELHIVYLALNVLYTTISGLTNRIANGDTAIIPPTDLWEKILMYLRELKQVIEDGGSTYPILEKIATLTYSLTGAGYYSLNYQKSLKAPNP